MVRALAVMLLVGCGRYGFEGGSDATTSATSLALAVSTAPSVTVASLTARVDFASVDPSALVALPADAGAPALPGSFVIGLPDEAGSATVTVEAVDALGRELSATATAAIAVDSQAHASVVIGADLGATCSNGVIDGGESGIDCGGPCPACPIDSRCGAAADCISGFCAAQVCEPISGPPSWLPIANMPTGRIGAGAALGHDDFVYVYGGAVSDSGTALTELDLYDSIADRWSAGPSLLTATHRLGGVTAPDGTIYALGGAQGTTNIANVEKLAPGASQWVAAPPLTSGREGFAAAVDASGVIYALAGSPTLNGAIAFNGASWAPLPAVPTPRMNVAGAIATDGSVYVIGGHDVNDSIHYANVEAYVPSSGSWATLPMINIARSDLCAARGPDGRVYAIGGYDGVAADADVDAYRAGSPRWVQVSPLSIGRDTCAATVAADGRILVFSGKISATAALASAEAYGPKIMLSAATGSPGDSITIVGANFAANTHAIVYFDQLPNERVATDGTGAFAAVTVRVPALASGLHHVTVMDDRSRYPVKLAFAVP